MREKERGTILRAKTLRRRLTEAETILWSRLRQRPGGVKFRRQHPIGPYIADFACVLPRLVIEVDGDTHGSDAGRAHDLVRDRYLAARGWRVFRVTNEDVFKRLDMVLDGIFRQLPPKEK